MRFGIDAMALLNLVENDLFVPPVHQLVAPQRIRSDALQGLLDAVRHGEVDEREAARRRDLLAEVKIRVLGDRMSRRTAWQLAMSHGSMEIPVAEYLAVSRLQADALVALDPHVRALAADIVDLASADDLLRQ
jgi:hypothetical protein